MILLALPEIPVKTLLDEIKSVTSLLSFRREDRSTSWCTNFFKLNCSQLYMLVYSALKKMVKAEMPFIYTIITRPFLSASFRKEVQWVCSPSVQHNVKHMGNLPALKGFPVTCGPGHTLIHRSRVESLVHSKTSY